MQSTTSLPDARGPCATAVSWSNGMSGGGGPGQPPSRQSAIITPKRVVRASRTGGPRPSSPGTVAWLWRVPVEGPRAAGEGRKRPRDPRRAGGLWHVAAHARQSPRNDAAVAWGDTLPSPDCSGAAPAGGCSVALFAPHRLLPYPYFARAYVRPALPGAFPGVSCVNPGAAAAAASSMMHVCGTLSSVCIAYCYEYINKTFFPDLCYQKKKTLWPHSIASASL